MNVSGCATLLLSWAYYRIGVCRPQGDFDELRFPLVERWRGYVVGMDSLEPRVRMWRMIFNGVDHAGVNWTPYADPNLEAIVSQTLLHLIFLGIGMPVAMLRHRRVTSGMMTDGARVSGIRDFCEDGMTCGVIALRVGWLWRWLVVLCSLPVSI
ncbi:hypothetical protein PIB30_043518 [Stylosanthes scabra]|uniref:Aminotransferase-like plant mobile domain-containing protein n=1 Tax=Stylosanthes scabra TaxID=79078 RepID=A0ABU6TF86_9FABA|nr:hypothetical protein [Stylosanthes scabra]